MRSQARIVTSVAAALFVVGVAHRPAPAAIVWDAGGGGNTNFFFADNWNPDTAIPNNGGTVADDLVMGAFNATFGSNVVMAVAPGNSFSFNSSTVTTGNVNSRFLGNGTLGAGDGFQTVNLTGTANIAFGWSRDTLFVLNDSGAITITNSNANDVLGQSGSVAFNSYATSLTLAAVPLASATSAALLAKMTVLGDPVVLGVNLEATPIGNGAGTLFTPIAPVPAPAALPAGAALIALLGARRRRR